MKDWYFDAKLTSHVSLRRWITECLGHGTNLDLKSCREQLMARL